MNQFNPVITKRTPSDTVFAELFLSPGPAAIGVTGQNRLQDFVGQEWMLLVDEETREVQLWRENGTWQQVVVPGHPLIGGIAPAGSRRFTLCFDQAATPVVAYELDGVIRVTRWDPVQQQYIQNVSFAGVDPALQFDAVWTGDIPGSDVLLFYLTLDRTGVRARVQRDLYAVERTVWDYPQPVILDRVIPAPLRYQVLVSDALGSPLDEALLSDLYPYGTQDFVVALGQPPVGGMYMNVILSAGEFLDDVSASGLPPSGGAYAEAAELWDFGSDAVSASGLPPTGGAYAPAVEYVESNTDIVAASGLPPTGGEIVNVTINLPNEHLDELEVTALPPSGGTYELA